MPEYRLATMLIAPLSIVLFTACRSDGNENAGVLSATPAAVPQSTDTASGCARSIPPLTLGPVTKDRLEAAVRKMREVQQAAEEGDSPSARAAFAGDTHDVTHDIDEPLRAADPELARDLCESVLAIEEQFARTPDLQAVADEAGVAAELLLESSRVLGLIE